MKVTLVLRRGSPRNRLRSARVLSPSPSLSPEYRSEEQKTVLGALGTRSALGNQADAVFQDELRDAGLAIQRNPERWARYRWGTRRYLLKRFPFVVV